VDCDLLVSPADRVGAQTALRELGYRRISGPPGDGAGYQVEFFLEDRAGLAYTIDLHWRISNVQSFAWLFAFADLASRSVEVPQLGANARRLGDTDALVLALLHRAANNRLVAPGYGDRLIWLYDLHLLVEHLTADQRAQFRRVVAEKHLGAPAWEGLRRCWECFRSPLVASLVAELECSGAANDGSRLVGADGLHGEWLELRAIPTMSGRLRYLVARLLPSAEYMRERYPDSAPQSLLVLHARRWMQRLIISENWANHNANRVSDSVRDCDPSARSRSA